MATFKRGDHVRLKPGVKGGPAPRIGEKNHTSAYVAMVGKHGQIMVDRLMKGFRNWNEADLELVSEEVKAA